MTVGLLLCSYNDLDLSKEMYPTLLETTGYEPWGLCVVDAGSTDGSIEYWESRTSVIHPGNEELLKHIDYQPDDLIHLSRALNAGAKYLLMNKNIDHVLHIHPDMKFIQKDWMSVLERRMESEPGIGKLAADWDHLRLGDRLGNQCPWLISRETIEKVIEKYGYLFDPGYRGIGGSEDWDLNLRLIKMGLKVLITSDAIVDHEGMGTRSRMDTNADAYYNRDYYTRKWGTYECPV